MKVIDYGTIQAPEYMVVAPFIVRRLDICLFAEFQKVLVCVTDCLDACRGS